MSHHDMYITNRKSKVTIFNSICAYIYLKYVFRLFFSFWVKEVLVICFAINSYRFEFQTLNTDTIIKGWGSFDNGLF
jgi:hypothetical protein